MYYIYNLKSETLCTEESGGQVPIYVTRDRLNINNEPK